MHFMLIMNHPKSCAKAALRSLIEVGLCSEFSHVLHLFPFRGPCHGRLDNGKWFPRCQESKQKEEGFFGGVGMARHSQNDWTVDWFRANVIEPFHSISVCLSGKKLPKKKEKKHHKSHKRDLQHTTPIFINVFAIALRCNHQLASSACLRRSTSSSAFAPSVWP